MERTERPSAPSSFPSPQAEFEHLGKRMRELEGQLNAQGRSEAKKEAAVQTVVEHHAALPQAVAQEVVEGGVHLPLTPEAHDDKMAELIGILMEKGAWSAMAAAEVTRSPHVVDDFHRVLAAYLSEGYGAKGLSRGSALYRSIAMVLYQITLPSQDGEDEAKQKPLKDLLSAMEQFYQGMQALPKTRDGADYFAFELANPIGSQSTVVYMAVPKAATELFEKQFSAVFPKARIERRPDDYNVFAESGHTAGASARLARRGIYALKSYDEFEHDPIGAVLSAFGRLDRQREGAMVQFLVSPGDRGLSHKYRHALERMAQGVPLHAATNIKDSVVGSAFVEVKEFFFPAKRRKLEELRLDSDPRIKAIERKVASPIMHVGIRLVASSPSVERSAAILSALEGAFKQFGDTAGNELSFTAVPRGKLIEFARKVAYRMYDTAEGMPLSTGELTAFAHLPPRETSAAPEFLQSKAALAPAPPDLPETGVLLGVNKYQGNERKVRLPDEDRLRHLYVIGQTGTGKSTLLKNVIIQDILAGSGVCMIDPHGSDVLEILSAIPPERHDDVIYFDPGAIDHPMGLNMLEYDPRHPEQKSLVVDELFGIFKKLFGDVPESMGPAFEQYFRNAALLVMDDPESGNTLLDISRIFADPSYRTLKLSRCKNPIVVQFWRGIAMQAGGEQSLENFGPYITSKFDVFTSNDFLRPIIAQQESSFDFRQIMDQKKILLVNLAKGRIGEMNANLLGLIIVGKFLIAALSRTDSLGKNLPPFYLHIDEFQNFTTNSIATIMSEARKYKLSLTVAHQFIAQLNDEIRDAVFGNVGSLCAFRVGAEDGEALEKQFGPTFTARDLMNIDNRNAYVRLLINGRPEKPFSLETLPFKPGSVETIDRLREVSYLKYGRDRAQVEADIMARYQPRASQELPQSI
jgi:hypothetical protein